jgi:hypothetical protein
MNVFATLFRAPTAMPSRRRIAVGIAAMFVLAAMVVGHAVALTLFLWDATARPSGAAVLSFLWVVSAIAIFLLVRFAHHAAILWRNGVPEQRPKGEQTGAP